MNVSYFVFLGHIPMLSYFFHISVLQSCDYFMIMVNLYIMFKWL